MFKIRDVASLLNVPTVEIHKKLISLKQELRDHLHQDRGITFIDDEGVQIISRGFLREEVLSKEQETSKNSDFKLNTKINSLSESENVRKSDDSGVGEHTVFLDTEEKNEVDSVLPFIHDASLMVNDIVEKNDTEIKRSYEINALKSEINKLDTEIYKTSRMMQDYIDQLGKKHEELEEILKERLF